MRIWDWIFKVVLKIIMRRPNTSPLIFRRPHLEIVLHVAGQDEQILFAPFVKGRDSAAIWHVSTAKGKDFRYAWDVKVQANNDRSGSLFPLDYPIAFAMRNSIRPNSYRLLACCFEKTESSGRLGYRQFALENRAKYRLAKESRGRHSGHFSCRSRLRMSVNSSTEILNPRDCLNFERCLSSSYPSRATGE